MANYFSGVSLCGDCGYGFYGWFGGLTCDFAGFFGIRDMRSHADVYSNTVVLTVLP